MTGKRRVSRFYINPSDYGTKFGFSNTKNEYYSCDECGAFAHSPERISHKLDCTPPPATLREKACDAIRRQQLEDDKGVEKEIEAFLQKLSEFADKGRFEVTVGAPLRLSEKAISRLENGPEKLKFEQQDNLFVVSWK